MTGRLLVVDDERGIVVALKGLFTKEGYEVETAESGEEALAKIRAGLFRVVITDLSLKGMNGLDLMRSVRQLDPGCSVLMITWNRPAFTFWSASSPDSAVSTS